MTSPQSLSDKLTHAKRETKALKAQLEASRIAYDDQLAAFDKSVYTPEVKEKPRTGALFNYNPRHSLNFQILVFSRQVCHIYQNRLRYVEPFSGRVPDVGLPHAQGVGAKAGCYLERPLLHATVVSQCQQKIDLQSHNLFLFVFTVNH